MNTATATAATTPTIPSFTPRADEAWWIELFGWKAACEEPSETESPNERLMRQASLLALLSVA